MKQSIQALRPKANRWLRLALASLSLFGSVNCASSAQAQEPEQDTEVKFSQEIQPLLARRCFACHGPDQAEAGLRLNSRDQAIAKLDSGFSAVVPGAPDQSEMLKRVRSTEEDHRMPPEGKPLSEREQKLIQRWIAQGAQWKKHWAFEPVIKPEIPTTASATSNPIDALIDQNLEKRSLKRAPQGEPLHLLRRLYFDLTGLPPTPTQAQEFLKRSESGFEQAWESEIDQLLASEQYGERWARHWLDVVRYAETNSFERDGAKPHVWRYRDYVILSLIHI